MNISGLSQAMVYDISTDSENKMLTALHCEDAS